MTSPLVGTAADPVPGPKGPGSDDIGVRAARALLVALTRLVTGAQARWLGCVPSTTQRVYFANHSSHLDTLVIWASLPPRLRACTRPVAAADYWDRPGLRRWVARLVLNAVLVDRAFTQAGAAASAKAVADSGPGGQAGIRASVPVGDHGGVRRSREALECLTLALAAGDSLILFPEGTRGDGLSVGAFKAGLYFVAQQRPDVELVPVFLQNLCRILPKGEYLPVPLLGSTSFGAPLRLAPGERRHEFLERARNALVGLGAEL